MINFRLIPFLVFLANPLHASETEVLTPRSVIEKSAASDWRTPNQSDLIYLQLDSGQVVFELAVDFAPDHVENLKTLLKEKYFDGLAIIRSHDNYVVQWGDPYSDSKNARPVGQARVEVENEFIRPLANLQFDSIQSRDPYADQVGFSKGFAVAAEQDRAWLIHCYGALGVGRGMQTNSGNATSLYMVTGHAPRHLDRNITLLGRAIKGLELLSSLPRGTGPLGFYETPEETTVINSIRLGSELAAKKS